MTDLIDFEDHKTIIHKVLVGSRLHGLENEQSDYDYRGIHLSPLADILDPFTQVKDTSWIEGDIDNTSYELAEFCRLATHGNATILEVFFSNKIIDTTGIATEMRDNWEKFMDAQKFVDASLGYARNNKNKFEDRNPVGMRGQYRRHKFAVAYCRVLWQCREFLQTGKFKCQIDPGLFRNTLLRWKNEWDDSFTMEAIAMYYELETQIHAMWASDQLDMKPDYKYIKEFIYNAYTSNA